MSTSGITQPDISKSVGAARNLVASLPKQVRFAASRAINTALRAGLQAEQARMASVFDRPTPYVLRGGVSVTPSTRDNLVGVLAIATTAATTATSAGNLPPGKPLLAEVQGGPRRAKRSELLLQRAGLLPAGWLTVPGKGAKIDAFGGIARGQILEILSWFQAYPQTNRRAGRARNSARDNISDKGKSRKRAGTRSRAGLEYFCIQPGGKGLHAGIYARGLQSKRYVGPVNRPRMVLAFVQRTQYHQKFDFVQQAHQAVLASLPGAFTAALGQALETAR